MASLEENLARYEKLIPHLHHTQMALWRRVDEEMMRAACSVMATWTKCRFLPRDDDSIAMMLNYCCFNVFFPDGRTLVDVYVAERAPESDDERAVLHAHQRSFFSLFEVLELVPRIGARLREVFTDETILVVYPRLAETMRPGLVLPIRVMPLDDFYVLFNGPIPHNNVPSIQQYEENLFKTYGKHGVQKGRALNAEQRANIETFQTIQVLAQRYPELIPADLRKPASASPTAAPRSGSRPPVTVMSVGRNDPCPCGSGKKFKQCCLRRRN
jgi:hypothetical protein